MENLPRGRALDTRLVAERGNGELADARDRQHGVGRAAAAAGTWASAEERSSIGCRSGRLHSVHRGVYAVGHTTPEPPGRWLAAVLAYGDDAVLSHRSAAALWGIARQRETAIDVTSPAGAGQARASACTTNAACTPRTGPSEDGSRSRASPARSSTSPKSSTPTGSARALGGGRPTRPAPAARDRAGRRARPRSARRCEPIRALLAERDTSPHDPLAARGSLPGLLSTTRACPTPLTNVDDPRPRGRRLLAEPPA